MYAALIYLLSSFYRPGDSCNCSVFLSLNEKNKITVYSTTQKIKVLDRVGHKLKEEDFVVFDILNANDSMYFVTASYAVSGKTIKGWISGNTRLAVFSKDPGKEILLYKEPENGEAVFRAPPTVNELAVLACKNGWLKISIKDKFIRYTGWIPPAAQCSNPYTTCN